MATIKTVAHYHSFSDGLRDDLNSGLCEVELTVKDGKIYDTTNFGITDDGEMTLKSDTLSYIRGDSYMTIDDDCAAKIAAAIA